VKGRPATQTFSRQTPLGKRTLPNGFAPIWELLNTQRFTSGAVYLSCHPKSA